MALPSQSRRNFLKTSGATAAAVTAPWYFDTSTSLDAAIRTPADKLNIGVIGSGGMANGNMRAAKDWLNIVAIADADEGRRQGMNKQFSDGKADVYEDYRKVLDHKDVQVVHIATPDHWHTKPVIEAMLAGKDIYCEKPLTLTIDEGKLIRKVQKETGRVVQVGTQQRSTFHLFVKAMAIVAEGRLGKLTQVQAAIGGAPSSPEIPVADVPENLNWDLWLGPAPAVDYRNLPPQEGKKGRGNTNCHYEFRWWYEYSGGKLTDWGAHHVDICNWALKLNGQTEGPTGIRGSATHPVEYKDGYAVQTDRYNTATKFQFGVDYADGCEMIIRNDTDNGIMLTGTKGRIFVNRGKLVGAPVDALKDNPLSEDAIAKVYKNLPMEHNERKQHWANFIYCVMENKEPISDVHTHMEMLNICHLAGISARLGRDLKWDNDKEEITGDDEANGFLARPYRKGYEIEMG